MDNCLDTEKQLYLNSHIIDKIFIRKLYKGYTKRINSGTKAIQWNYLIQRMTRYKGHTNDKGII